ncbi:MAG: PQQ-binding-like beta-propeller repeat protein [Rhizobiaceae bacterium]|nr:PQQ-binding-like beta-propeller repeat protein [Rhizobiaceae bacterium]MCV0408332.1 PQQ-binding-like beta-propeller repeat protein [Rhizobiaceae bacterium]
MRHEQAEIIREYGPYEGINEIHGVSFDGSNVWFASGERLNALDPDSGMTVRTIDVPSHAGTAYDGRHLFQLAGDSIMKIDPDSGRVLTTIPAPGNGNSGLAWAEGSLWVGQYADNRIVEIDPETGEVRRTINCERHVTGVTWVDGELWHGTWQDDTSDLRRIDPETGEVLTRLDMPAGTGVSGLESDGRDRLFAGGGRSGKLRAIRRPAKAG